MTENKASHVSKRPHHVVDNTDWADATELNLEVLRLRDELISAQVELGETRAKLQVAAVAAQTLENIYGSRSYKLARLFQVLINIPRKIIGDRGKA